MYILKISPFHPSSHSVQRNHSHFALLVFGTDYWLSLHSSLSTLHTQPHDRRITKIHDGDGCLIPLAIDGMDLGGFLKISTRQVRNRIGTDSVLGVGFDCSSTSSWNKPRIYWVNQVTRSSLDSQGNLHQDYHENRDLILSLLLPHHFRGWYSFHIHRVTLFFFVRSMWLWIWKWVWWEILLYTLRI